MTRSVSDFVRGVPYGHSKVGGANDAPKTWTESVITQTRALQKISGPCVLRVTFFLPKDKFPSDHPFGNDLKNLVKCLFL
jgi:hypothetical protein